MCALQLLLNPEMVKACPTLISYVYDFLENKAYSKGKGEFARKVPFFFFPPNRPQSPEGVLLLATCTSPPFCPPISLPDRSTPLSTPCAAP